MFEHNFVFVVGHKNPDTDSVCSAIAYAELKNTLHPSDEYVPMRAGHLNEETQFVLKKFGVMEPPRLNDVRTQVRDIEIRQTPGVNRNISLKKAWTLMNEIGVVTLPITNRNKLEGLITITDIAMSYMDVYDSRILARAKTQYKNILETLDADMVVGDKNAYFEEGKVLVAAANPDLMEDYIEPGDLVILGNRYESQLCAIEMEAKAIIVCEGAKISKTIQQLAKDHQCTVIRAPHDTFTVARLINQSMPISYFMRRDSLITFRTDSYVDEARAIMAKKRHRDFPILDRRGNYIGMISRRNLLGSGRKRVILVDHNEQKQAVDGIEDAEILEIIDHHRLGTIETISPVFFRNQPLGCTATIVYQMYQENQVEIKPEIAGLLCSAILSDTLMYRSPTCTQVDKEAAEQLANIAGIDVRQYATEMFRAGSNLKNKSAKEIFHQDYKKFSMNDTTFGVGQISSMDEAELKEIKERLVPYMNSSYEAEGVNMLFFMLTNMVMATTELLCKGSGAAELVQTAFSFAEVSDSYILEGVVSRKKQLIPELMIAIQQED